jgi:hypothetical protein
LIIGFGGWRIHSGDHETLPLGELLHEGLTLGRKTGDPCADVGDLLFWGWLKLGLFCFADRLRFRRPERLEALLGVTAAKLVVRGDGLAAGGCSVVVLIRCDLAQ